MTVFWGEGREKKKEETLPSVNLPLYDLIGRLQKDAEIEPSEVEELIEELRRRVK